MSSENIQKPRQFFKPDDFKTPNVTRQYAADIANEKLAPILKLMSEMAEALEFYDGAHRQSWCIDFSDLPKKAIGPLNSYKSFIAQNGLGDDL